MFMNPRVPSRRGRHGIPDAISIIAAVSSVLFVGCASPPSVRTRPVTPTVSSPPSPTVPEKSTSADRAGIPRAPASQVSPPAPKEAVVPPASSRSQEIAVSQPPADRGPVGSAVPTEIKTVARPRPSTFVEPRPAVPLRIEYPQQARRFGQQGVVEIELTVNEVGVVTGARVASSSGVPLLDETARLTMAGARFVPARRDGLAVAHTFRQAVRFVLLNADKQS